MGTPKSVQDGDDGIFKVDTVPPPDGEDAYGAPTKVGPLSHAVIADMMREAVEPPVVGPASGVRMSAEGEEAHVTVGELPNLSVEDEDNEPTQLSDPSRRVGFDSTMLVPPTTTPAPPRPAMGPAPLPGSGPYPAAPYPPHAAFVPSRPPLPHHSYAPPHVPTPPPGFAAPAFAQPGVPQARAQQAGGAGVTGTEVVIVLTTFLMVTTPMLWWLFR
jgi:hypothetical protein